MTSYWGFGDGYEWSYHTGQFSHEDFDRWLPSLQHELDGGVGPVASLIFAQDGETPPARERARIAAMVSSPGGRRIAARAFVTNSAALRVVLRGIDWLAPPHFDSAYFERGGPAFAWLQQRVPRLDLRALREHVVRAVPAEVLRSTDIAPPTHHSLPRKQAS